MATLLPVLPCGRPANHPTLTHACQPLPAPLPQATSRLLAAVDELRGSRVRVALVGATNRLEGVDPALRRAGRLDREVRMGRVCEWWGRCVCV